jgi:pimeloyl-ACP methyl ester carboxylesterase
MAWRPWWPSTSAGGSARTAARRGGPAAAAEAFMRRIVGDERWERLPASTREPRREEGDALLADLAAMRGDEPFRCDQITVPVVVGFGTETNERHRRAAEELAAEAQRAELIAVPGAAHNAHDSHPEAFAGFVRAVVAQAADASTLGQRS